jgi:hypothetical protein
MKRFVQLLTAVVILALIAVPAVAHNVRSASKFLLHSSPAPTR